MQKLMKFMAIFCGIFIAMAMSLVIYMGQNKIVVIAQSGSDIRQNYTDDMQQHSPMLLKQTQVEGALLEIPLEEGISPEQITIENVYSEQKLIITLKDMTGEIYSRQAIQGYVPAITEATFVKEHDNVILYINLTQAYEYESVLDKGILKINLYKPSEKYDRIVILDEQGNETLDESRKQLLHDITEEIQYTLEENDIRVYHLEDPKVSDDTGEKKKLISQLEADLYVEIGLADDQTNVDKFGTITGCDVTYYRPYLSNATFADVMQKEIVTAVQGRANGIIQEENNTLLQELEIPAITVYPGHVSNPLEYEYMKQLSYQERIATGFTNGIIKVFEMMGEEK